MVREKGRGILLVRVGPLRGGPAGPHITLSKDAPHRGGGGGRCTDAPQVDRERQRGVSRENNRRWLWVCTHKEWGREDKTIYLFFRCRFFRPRKVHFMSYGPKSFPPHTSFHSRFFYFFSSFFIYFFLSQ